MPLVADRTKETSTTTGTGTLTLQGAPTGFQTFTAAFGNGVSVYYVIAGGSEYEIGIGTTGAGTLSRDTVLQSTNADALVPFSAGVKDVFCAYVADRAVTTSDAATLTNKTIDSYTNNVGANSTHFRVKASAIIPKGAVVKAVGFTPGQQAVEVAVVASSADVAIGITEQALTSGQFGMAVVIGELFDVNTAGYTLNDVLYSNGAGGFTATKPSSGTYQTLGTIVRANTNNGVIAVNIVSPQYVEVSTNTANTLALRDGSGNFAAGTITAALTGNASTATALQTARAINGVNFDGTAAITVTAAAGTLTGATLAANVLASSLTSVGTLAGLTVTAPITGSITGSSGSTTGNAATATALQTARAINGVNFDGTAAITVTADAGTLTGATLASNVLASSLTSVGTLAGLTVTNPITGSVTGSSGSTTGNAATATALQTARNINGVSFNGTADVTVTAAAGTLSGASLASGVTASSLTSVGTLSALTTSGTTSLATSAGALSVRNVAYTFPAAQGAASTLLTNNGSGTLTWATASAPTQTIVSTAATYDLTSADAGKQIVYTGSGSSTTAFIRTGTSFAAALTTGQFVDLANIGTNLISLGGGTVFDSAYTQSTVASSVNVMRKCATGKVLVAWGNSIARFNANGTVDSTFTTRVANNTIVDIALNADESKIYVCGSFSAIDGASRSGVARLDGVTGAVDSWNVAPYTQPYSIAVSGTTVCTAAAGTYLQFWSTTGTGSSIGSVWRQYGGEPYTYSTPAGIIVRGHPSIANTFIGVCQHYNYTDENGDSITQDFETLHFTTGGPALNYTSIAPAAVPDAYYSQAVVVTATHIYWSATAGTPLYLFRVTIGSTSSTVAASTQYSSGSTDVKFLWQRPTDSAWFIGTQGNTVSPTSATALYAWTSALATISLGYNVLSFSNFRIAGAGLADGSLLLGNVYNNGDTYLSKTVVNPEGGATVSYPPSGNGYGGFDTTTAQTTFGRGRTFRLQKMSNGKLLIVATNSSFTG